MFHKLHKRYTGQKVLTSLTRKISYFKNLSPDKTAANIILQVNLTIYQALTTIDTIVSKYKIGCARFGLKDLLEIEIMTRKISVSSCQPL